jgi:hypothetical protein
MQEDQDKSRTWAAILGAASPFPKKVFPDRNKIPFTPVYRCHVWNIFCYGGARMMKWYYEWKLSRVRTEIAALEEQTKMRLLDDYTGHSRLRVLYKLAGSLEGRLAKYSSATERMEAGEVH